MQDNYRQIWQHIAGAIRQQVNADTFQRWFAAIELMAADEQTMTLRVPNSIYQLWIENNYMPTVQSAIISVLGAARQIRFTVPDNLPPIESLITAPQQVPATVAALAAAPTSVLAGSGYDTRRSAIPSPLPIETLESLDGSDPITSPASAGGLNPRHTFESFVIGQNNQFAHAAAKAVAEAPAKTYNPLFVYGGVGLGKTHLMQAIGQDILAKRKNHKVIYISSEKFTNEFIDAIQNSSLVKFRKRYRLADVLLIDDIQFLAGKERSQEEFFHTFNTLFDGHKQIVLSSDRPPSEIQNLEHRLVSRFEWGLTAELQPPDIETRQAILRKKAEAMQVKLRPEVLDFLAQRIRTNVRRLEGALIRVASFASLRGGDLGPEQVESLLRDILQEEARKTVTVDQIQRAVAEHYDVRLADMTSKRRPANIAFPRQVAMYLARELTKSSLSEIGDAFGGRDHGTVMHAHKLVKRRMKEDERTRQIVLMLDSQLQR
ncbi:MAG: chromosomal replication initiator protein DnaA [Verrucomicrobia bacterium]|nr:chromosomal replication initiator protein DnaA [Verrucomicrobiota bacterium]